MSDIGLLQETASTGNVLKTELLSYPPVFKQALYRLSWTKAPENLLTSAEQMKLAMQVSARSLADMEEKYWQTWQKLQREHALD